MNHKLFRGSYVVSKVVSDDEVEEVTDAWHIGTLVGVK